MSLRTLKEGYITGFGLCSKWNGKPFDCSKQEWALSDLSFEKKIPCKKTSKDAGSLGRR